MCQIGKTILLRPKTAATDFGKRLQAHFEAKGYYVIIWDAPFPI